MRALSLDTGNTPAPLSGQSSAAQRLEQLMEKAGWTVNFVDLDFTGDRPKADIRVHRIDGPWLHARVDSLGRASIERHQRERGLGMTPNTKGRRPLSPQVDDVFLGRSMCTGARQMLRSLTNYLADNALNPVTVADVRAVWAGVLGAPAHLEQLPLEASPGDEAR